MPDIRLLPSEFRKKAIQYRQIERLNNLALYSLAYCSNVSAIIGYDVIRVRMYTLKADMPEFLQRVRNDNEIIECYPTSEKWGTQGWSFITYAAAKEKFNSLIGELKK